MERTPESAEIMARLAELGSPASLKPQRRQRNPLVVNTTKSRRGMLTPRTLAQRSVNYGRRRHSPYQARALSSGSGILPAADIQFTMSPQDNIIGWNTSHWTSTGYSTVQEM